MLGKSSGSITQWVLAGLVVGVCAGCGAAASPSSTPVPPPPEPGQADQPPVLSGSPAAQIALRLGRKPNFLIGLGNDLNADHNRDGAYTLGVTLDIHYAYLTGLPGRGGWPDWNQDGSFVNILADTAKAHGVTPMFTLYSMAASGENNMGALMDEGFMSAYWAGVRLLFQRAAVFDGPLIVQFEPDFWAYSQHSCGSKPTTIPVRVASLVPECQGRADNLVGFGRCMVQLGRKYAPKAVLAFHASRWAHGDAAKVAEFLQDVGAGDADILTTDTLDRDAGCFEAHTDPNCQRKDGPWYWDETNATSPNFREHLAWVKSLTSATGKPMLWWQTPLGVPNVIPGGSASRYRDNRVKYIFSHIDEFVAAGGLGAVFGTGAGNQTHIESDGGQFREAVVKYYRAPARLP